MICSIPSPHLIFYFSMVKIKDGFAKGLHLVVTIVSAMGE
jgi:hypothetical protein